MRNRPKGSRKAGARRREAAIEVESCGEGWRHVRSRICVAWDGLRMQ